MSFHLLCSAPSLPQSLILHALLSFSSYARIPSTGYVIYISSRPTLSFGVWHLTQSSYRSNQQTLSWKHKLHNLIHWSSCPLRTLTAIWNRSWQTSSMLDPPLMLGLLLDWGQLRKSSFLFCSPLPFYSKCWSQI